MLNITHTVCLCFEQQFKNAVNLFDHCGVFITFLPVNVSDIAWKSLFEDKCLLGGHLYVERTWCISLMTLYSSAILHLSVICVLTIQILPWHWQCHSTYLSKWKRLKFIISMSPIMVQRLTQLWFHFQDNGEDAILLCA